MKIETLFSNEKQLARDARGTAERLADGKIFDDASLSTVYRRLPHTGYFAMFCI